MPSAPPDLDIQLVRAQAMTCQNCRLAETRTQVVWAAGNLEGDLLFIGEAPGFHEDKQGIPFVGAAGRLLTQLMGEVGLDRNDAAIVNVLKCRPPGNRDPEPDEIEACTPYLEAQISHMSPRVIVTLGNFATRFVLKQQIGITRARGQLFAYGSATVIPTFHPAAALRGGSWGGVSTIDAMRADLAAVRRTLDSLPPRQGLAEEANGEQMGLF